MKRLVMALLLVEFIAGHAHADALWYALENGSKVDFINGDSINLTGRIALAECGEKKVNMKGTRIFLPIYDVQIDNLPDALQPHINDLNSRVTLFGGTGSVEVSGKPALIANLDGKVFSFDWFLQQQLEQDYGNEAVIFNRLLQLEGKSKSSLSFQDEQQTCPDSIELHLVTKDTRSTYKPHIATSASGVQTTETVTSSHTEEVIGHVSIIAKAISGSEEKINDRVYKRLKLAEGPYIQSGPVHHIPVQHSGKPLPADAYRASQGSQRPEVAPSTNNIQAE